jgi:hypothetical protein
MYFSQFKFSKIELELMSKLSKHDRLALPRDIGRTLMMHIKMNEMMMQMLMNFIAFDLRRDISHFYMAFD